jgi:hypothetical protein
MTDAPSTARSPPLVPRSRHLPGDPCLRIARIAKESPRLAEPSLRGPSRASTLDFPDSDKIHELGGIRPRFGNPDLSGALYNDTREADARTVLTLLTHARPRRMLEVGTAPGHMRAYLARSTPGDARVFTTDLVRGMAQAAAGADEQQVEVPDRAGWGRFADRFGLADEEVVHVGGTEEAYLRKGRDVGQDSNPVIGSHQKPDKIGILSHFRLAWEGGFEGLHSLAMSNRAIRAQLIACGHDVRMGERVPAQAQVHVRHPWPPDPDPPPGSRWVLMHLIRVHPCPSVVDPPPIRPEPARPRPAVTRRRTCRDVSARWPGRSTRSWSWAASAAERGDQFGARGLWRRVLEECPGDAEAVAKLCGVTGRPCRWDDGESCRAPSRSRSKSWNLVGGLIDTRL